MDAREVQSINANDDRNAYFQGFSGKLRLQHALMLSFVLLVLLQGILITQTTPS